jgi:hypothetical protein
MARIPALRNRTHAADAAAHTEFTGPQLLFDYAPALQVREVRVHAR